MGFKSEFGGGGLPRKVLILALVGLGAWYLPQYYKKPDQVKGVSFTNLDQKYIPKEVNTFVMSAQKNVQDSAGAVLGQATQMVQRSVSKQTQKLPETIYDQAVSNLIKQIDRLPKKEKEQLRQVVCK